MFVYNVVFAIGFFIHELSTSNIINPVVKFPYTCAPWCRFSRWSYFSFYFFAQIFGFPVIYSFSIPNYWKIIYMNMCGMLNIFIDAYVWIFGFHMCLQKLYIYIYICIFSISQKIYIGFQGTHIYIHIWKNIYKYIHWARASHCCFSCRKFFAILFEGFQHIHGSFSDSGNLYIVGILIIFPPYNWFLIVFDSSSGTLCIVAAFFRQVHGIFSDSDNYIFRPRFHNVSALCMVYSFSDGSILFRPKLVFQCLTVARQL